ERGRQAGRTTADDDEIVVFHLGYRGQAELGRELGVARLDQRAPVFEEDRRDDPLAAVHLLDEREAIRVLLDVDPVVVDPLLAEELLGALTVAAPRRAVDGDVDVLVHRSELLQY